MEREWERLLLRFGQPVTLRQRGDSRSLRAFVQPVLERGGRQEVPTPLGLRRQDRFLYLGPAGHPLNLDTLVEWQGQEYQVQSAHRVGEGICPHWRAVLCPRDEVRA